MDFAARAGSVREVAALLEVLRSQRVQEFEGLGLKVKFAFTAMLPERQQVSRATQPEQGPANKAADMLRARLGSVDEALAAEIGEAL